MDETLDKVLNIDREVTKDTVAELEDNSSNQPNDISREEIVLAMIKKLSLGRAS